MKVRELVAKLAEFDPELQVAVEYEDDGVGLRIGLYEPGFELDTLDGKPALVIHLDE